MGILEDRIKRHLPLPITPRMSHLRVEDGEALHPFLLLQLTRVEEVRPYPGLDLTFDPTGVSTGGLCRRLVAGPDWSPLGEDPLSTLGPVPGPDGVVLRDSVPLLSGDGDGYWWPPPVGAGDWRHRKFRSIC